MIFSRMRTLCLGLCTSLSLLTQCLAAEFDLTPEGIRLSGRIEPGDSHRFARWLKVDNERGGHLIGGTLTLNSPGGSVAEALQIGTLVREALGKVAVMKGDVCYSACFLVFAGGVSRLPLGTLGLHRLARVEKTDDIREQELSTSPAIRDVSRYLRRMGIPQRLIDQMNETPPTDLLLLTPQKLTTTYEDVAEPLLGYAPFVDIVEQSCGRDPMAEAMHSRPVRTDEAKRFADCQTDVRMRNVERHIDRYLKKLDELSK